MSSDPWINKHSLFTKETVTRWPVAGLGLITATLYYERGTVDSTVSFGQMKARNEANLKEEDQRRPINTRHPLRENLSLFMNMI